MTYRSPARITSQWIARLLVAAFLVVTVATGYQLLASASSASSAPGLAMEAIPRDQLGGLDAGDGVLPVGTTVFDDQLPGIVKLASGLLVALRRAANDAADDGVEFNVDSGWRSPAYQDQLLREAVSTYGSEDAAARWVATAATSPHVSGDAVDLGTDASAWLSKHGAGYGLCQIYRNEPWHFERRRSAINHGCPPMYADPTRDPRMQP